MRSFHKKRFLVKKTLEVDDSLMHCLSHLGFFSAGQLSEFPLSSLKKDLIYASRLSETEMLLNETRTSRQKNLFFDFLTEKIFSKGHKKLFSSSAVAFLLLHFAKTSEDLHEIYRSFLSTRSHAAILFFRGSLYSKKCRIFHPAACGNYASSFPRERVREKAATFFFPKLLPSGTDTKLTKQEATSQQLSP